MTALRLRQSQRLTAPWSLPEVVLIARARGGDVASFDTLIQLQEKGLTGFLHRSLPSEAVDDVLQETRLAAWSALPRFEPRVRFKTWLYRIARNKAADWLRSRPSETSLELQPEHPALSHAPDTDLPLQVRAFLQSLGEEQRGVLELYYYDGLTLPEVALVLERNLNTVKYHFYQAHKRGVAFWSEEEET